MTIPLLPAPIEQVSQFELMGRPAILAMAPLDIPLAPAIRLLLRLLDSMRTGLVQQAVGESMLRLFLLRVTVLAALAQLLLILPLLENLMAERCGMVAVGLSAIALPRPVLNPLLLFLRVMELLMVTRLLVVGAV